MARFLVSILVACFLLCPVKAEQAAPDAHSRRLDSSPMNADFERAKELLQRGALDEALTAAQAGLARSRPELMRAFDWLRSHQNRQFGYWTAESMNKPYEPDSMPVRFMQDAATSFAAMALLETE